MTPDEKQITQLYIGYFGRAADPDGLNFWVGQANAGGAIIDIANSFAASGEYLGIYGGLSNAQLLDQIYLNLFDRAPDLEGRSYWLNELANGKPVARLMVDVMSGAQGNDRMTLERAVLNAGNGLTVTVLDDAGTLAPYEAGIRQSVSVAWDMWASHFLRTAPIEIEIRFQNGFPGQLAYTTPQSVFSNEGGSLIAKGIVGIEIKTGVDSNGSAPDGVVYLAGDLSKFAFRASVDDPMPSDKMDAISIFAHEIGHLLGFQSYFRPGQLPIRSEYDKLVTGATFTGPSLPNGIALVQGDVAHIAEQSDLMHDSIFPGEVKMVGVVDIAIMADLGITVT